MAAKKEKKVAKKTGEFRGRPGAGVKTWSSVIDALLLKGGNTKQQIVDEVMRDGELKVPKDHAKNVSTLVSVRMARAKMAGATVKKDEKTKTLKVVPAAGQANPWHKPKKEKAPKVVKPKKEKAVKAAKAPAGE